MSDITLSGVMLVALTQLASPVCYARGLNDLQFPVKGNCSQSTILSADLTHYRIKSRKKNTEKKAEYI